VAKIKLYASVLAPLGPLWVLNQETLAECHVSLACRMKKCDIEVKPKLCTDILAFTLRLRKTLINLS
jgi:hypothetical protein